MAPTWAVPGLFIDCCMYNLLDHYARELTLYNDGRFGISLTSGVGTF